MESGKIIIALTDIVIAAQQLTAEVVRSTPSKDAAKCTAIWREFTQKVVALDKCFSAESGERTLEGSPREMS